MQVICPWCEKFIKEKEPLKGQSISCGSSEECCGKVREEMKIRQALNTAAREWGNIRLSLEMCGDIGEFDLKDFVSKGSDWLSFFRNIAEMEYKYPSYGYSTHQAAYVFAALASKAGERLGLRNEFAVTFGGGYSCVRTGWFCPYGGVDKQSIVKQIFFFKLFSPLGGDSSRWDFKSPVARTKMKLIFDTFIKWQDNPSSYIQDVRDYKTQLEPIWYGLLLTLGAHNLNRSLFQQWC